MTTQALRELLEKATKGPWEFVCGVGPGGEPTVSAGERCVATLPSIPGDAGYTVKEEDVANAHLIAAAPELYEALAEVKRWIDGAEWDSDIDIDAVLAKARGETT